MRAINNFNKSLIRREGLPLLFSGGRGSAQCAGHGTISDRNGGENYNRPSENLDWQEHKEGGIL